MQPMFVCVSIHWEEGCIKKVPLLFSYHNGKEGNPTGFLSNNYSGQPKLINYSNHNKSVNFIGLLPKFKPNLLLQTRAFWC